MKQLVEDLRARSAWTWVYAAVALLALRRLAYHLDYVLTNPFALATFSDGQIYELAARDLLAHPPLGSAPFYLQGLYAYLLAAGMALHDSVLAGLLVQLVLAWCALGLFFATAARVFGPRIAALSTALLLAYPTLAFYETKYLSASLGVACNIAALYVVARLPADGPLRRGALSMVGLTAGLCVLARPNMIVAIAFTAWAVWSMQRARTDARQATRAVATVMVGVVLALAPMALRNLVVTGSATITPSHGGGTSFYIGNGPDSNGRWNDAGGLLSGQVLLERTEVARKLDIHEPPGAAQDAAIGRALYARAWQHIREQPGAWLALLAHKAWLTIGNHPFVHDYDMNGERELLGAHHLWGIPFGVLLALGWLGLLALWRTQRTLWWVLVGQLCAVLAANVLVFTSAQNRMPLAIPLALAAGPGLMTLRERARDVRDTFRPSVLALGVSAMLLAQAFWPRLQSSGRPSSVHYFNLASIEELLGRNDAALAHYAQAAQRKPDQPFFALRHAIMLRRTGQAERARAEARRGLALPNLDPALRGALQSEATRDAAP